MSWGGGGDPATRTGMVVDAWRGSAVARSAPTSIGRAARDEVLAAGIPGVIAKVEGGDRTETLISFQVYSKHDLERLFSIGFEED